MRPPIPPRERLERLLGGETLAGLRARLRRRYERGLATRVFTLAGLLPVERRTLEGLLGLPPRFEVAGRVVHVCENPAVVAMAADRLGPRCAPLLCTEGMPSAAQRTLLAQLAQAGALLRYHGDFDWPGITIGNFVMREFGARPWRFAAADYAPAAGRALAGDPVPALRDPHLAAKMQARGRVLEEEAVIETLLADLGPDLDEQCAHRPAGSSPKRVDAGSS